MSRPSSSQLTQPQPGASPDLLSPRPATASPPSGPCSLHGYTELELLAAEGLVELWKAVRGFPLGGHHPNPPSSGSSTDNPGGAAPLQAAATTSGPNGVVPTLQAATTTSGTNAVVPRRTQRAKQTDASQSRANKIERDGTRAKKACKRCQARNLDCIVPKKGKGNMCSHCTRSKCRCDRQDL